MTTIKRQIQLMRNGENHVFYKVATSDDRAVLMAIHSLEQKQGLMRGALVKYFRDKDDQSLWDGGKVEVHII